MTRVIDPIKKSTLKKYFDSLPAAKAELDRVRREVKRNNTMAQTTGPSSGTRKGKAAPKRQAEEPEKPSPRKRGRPSKPAQREETATPNKPIKAHKSSQLQRRTPIFSPTRFPKEWIKCEDPSLRFRIAVFNDASNFTLEVVELELVISKSKTTSIGVRCANVTLSRASGIYCFGITQAAGTQCELSEPPLTLASSSPSFTSSLLNIIWSLSRSDGPQSGACTEAWTFYIYDPNVSVLGPLTLGRGPEYGWQAHCNTTWACGGTGNSVNSWTNCASTSFQFVKTLPAGGDTLKFCDGYQAHISADDGDECSGK
ncbi:hypothetical protein BDZ45DRAFT_722020 [Acephala macrosclerotiorum]|nr:hypothetical protein BDZ45DRAFT_722020 [Acephala macrosclerotiorum]